MLHLDELRNLGIRLTGLPLINCLSGYTYSTSKLILCDFLEFSEFHKFFFKSHFVFSFVNLFILLLFFKIFVLELVISIHIRIIICIGGIINSPTVFFLYEHY